jgi:hypothetical protein
MTKITAYYRASKTFEIPAGVFLLPQDENEKAEEGTIGMWWIKWGELHYITDDGCIGVIVGADYDIDSKWPEDIDVDSD